MFQVYQPSGRFSPVFLVWWVASMLVVTAAAFVYQLGLEWIPFIYINFVLTWCMAILIGTATGYVIKWGHLRSVGLSLLCFGVLVVVGLGAKFTFQYLTRCETLRQELASKGSIDFGFQGADQLNDEELKDLKEEILASYTFAMHIQERVDQGWQVGRAGGGAPISGPFVYGVWLVELGVILYFAGSIVWTAARQPYSEKMGQWADEETVDMTLPVTNAKMVEQIRAATSVQELLQLPIPDNDQSDRFAVYTVNSIPGDDQEDAYLTVDLQTYSTNSKGETEVKSESLVRCAVITAAQRLQLRENSELMAEAIEAYRASKQAPPPEISEAAQDEEPA